MFLLDTNVVSEMRKLRSARMDPDVEHWFEHIPPSEFFLSVITIKELEQGVMRKERRDPQQGRCLRGWFEKSVLLVYRDRILPVTTAVARVCATLNVPDPRPVGDALIAATARVHAFRVVTRNVADFVGTGVDIVDPWQRPAGTPGTP